MSRTSHFLAIALSVTAIGSAVTPAAALPSQVFGGANSRIAPLMHPSTAIGMQTSRDASHVLAPGLTKVPAGAPIRTSLGTAQIPISKLPVGSSTMKQPQIPVSELPPPPYKPGPGVDNICPFNPSKCPPKPPKKPDDDDDKGHGPVVIFAPSVGIPVPVGVPVTAPMHVATAPTSAATAPAKPVASLPSSSSPVASQCGANGTIPALAAGIDELLPTAQLSKDDLAKVTELRQTIQDLAALGKVAAARNVEEVAMYYLGYQKIWLQCGAGTFAWQQIVYNDTAQAADQSK